MAAESTVADFVGQESPLGDAADIMKDMGALAVWSLSGAKPGNGIDQLLDDDVRVRVCVLVVGARCCLETSSLIISLELHSTPAALRWTF